MLYLFNIVFCLLESISSLFLKCMLILLTFYFKPNLFLFVSHFLSFSPPQDLINPGYFRFDHIFECWTWSFYTQPVGVNSLSLLQLHHKYVFLEFGLEVPFLSLLYQSKRRHSLDWQTVGTPCVVFVLSQQNTF